MKINILRFKNLNSLRGEFTVNFNEHPLGGTGIFAITGPTGAGKTTILDAICVALYGRTPRLGAGESSELMSRHTGDCFAEVDFSVKKGNYRSKWMQRRAREKPDGKLQPSVMELASLDNGSPRILEEKKSLVPGRIEEITGLDFNRFTRSILLAQGSFAEFLKATENERADLLEKMTGTEIYSLISQKVFERAKKEQSAMAELSLQRDNFKLMGPEETENENLRMKEKKEQVKEINNSLKGLIANEKWLISLKELEAALESGQKELCGVHKEKDNAAEDFKRFENAGRTRPLKGDFDLFESLSRQLKNRKQDKDELNKKIPDMEELLAKQKKAEGEAKKEWDIFLKDAETKEEAIKKTLVKDQEIQNKQSELTDKKSLLAVLGKKIEHREKEYRDIDTKIGVLVSQKEKAEKYMEEHKEDRLLEQDGPLIKELFSDLIRKNKKYKVRETTLKSGRLSVERFSNSARAAFEKSECAAKAVKAKASEKREAQEALERTIKGKALEQREKEEKELLNKEKSAERLLELGKIISEKTRKINNAEKVLKEAQKEFKSKRNAQRDLEGEKKTEDDIFSQLKEKQKLEILIAKYEEDRGKLTPGAPCPLCGSENHPWSEEGVLKISDSEKALLNQEKKLKALQQDLEQVAVRISGLTTEEKQQKKIIEEESYEKRDLLNSWNENCVNFDPKPDPTKCQAIEEMLNAIKMHIEENRNQVDEIKKIMDSEKRLNEEIIKTEQEKSALYSKYQEANNEKGKAETEAKLLKQELDELGKEIDISKDTLNKKLKPYKEKIMAGDDQKLIKRINERNDVFLHASGQIKESEKLFIPLNQQKSTTIQDLKSNRERTQEEENLIKKINKSLITLRKERQELLGDDDPDKVQKHLKDTRACLDNGLKENEKNVSLAITELKTKKELLKSLERDFETLEKETNDIRTGFDKKLSLAGFTDLSAFKESQIDESEYSRLEILKRNLDNKETQAKTRLQDTEKKLKIEQEKKFDVKTLEEIKGMIETREKQREQLLRDLGKIDEILTNQEKLKQEQIKLLDKIILQKKEFDRWNNLNDLIGSADGKKFRRFAQGLTFDYLIGLANKHFRKLNDRYFLRRTKEEELGLEVVDTYQADVSRPVNTLSGGEAFLSSLALALGLSDISGKKTSIDSLFLDEGFGTLDPETLETALAAMDALQASGKTIGIISHVEALKDRIPVQIVVKKMSAGVSSLKIIELQ